MLHRNESRVGLLAVLAVFFALPLGAQEVRLMPVPQQLVWGEGSLIIDQGFRISLTGYDDPRLQRAAERLINRLSNETGIPMHPLIEADSTRATLIIRCDHGGESVQSVREDESYELEVKPDRALLSASTPVGILRGIETFLQLIELGLKGFAVPVVTIQDKPRFPWRGLMIDVSRHWIPVAMIKRNLDAMAAVKLNVFHWHLTDNPAFRIESRTFPKLHQLGSEGLYYTQDEIRDVVAYARDRGIRVVPEFDVPGHSASWFVGYPELASMPGPYTLDHLFHSSDPVMDPTRDEIYEFLDAFFDEMADLFPDAYIHTGGDGFTGQQWGENPRIQTFMHEHGMNGPIGRGKEGTNELEAYFNQRVHAILKKHAKKMIGWQEVLRPELPRDADIIIQSWQGQESLADAARRGFIGILSAGYYLDQMTPASLHYRVDPLEDAAASLTPAEQSRVLGGEACQWTENIGKENFDAKTWPMAAAIAERLWSPQRIKDVDSMYRRLALLNRELELLGLTHRTAPRMMLERLAGNVDPQPLIVLDQLLEPLNSDLRRSARPNFYTTQTPLNRLVDATPVESGVAREFTKLVGDPRTNKAAIREQLHLWRDNSNEVIPLMQKSELLQEALPLNELVIALATAGLEAMDYMESGDSAPASWVSRQRILLDEARKPHAELLIAIVPSIAALVEAAQKGRSQVSRSKNVVRIPSAPSSVTLTVPIETGWAIEFRCNHDDRELTCVIANLKHGKEERYPELLIDPQNRRSSNWQRGQWWLHSSYNLCEGNGEFNVYVHNGIHQCTKDKLGWRANHFPLNADDVMTIHVSLSKIGLLPGHQFGFAVDVTDTQSDWHFWPPGASLKSPATWGAVELTQRPGP